MVNLSCLNNSTVIYIAGTFDTKARELNYMRDCLTAIGLATCTVDLSTTKAERILSADVSAVEIAGHHPYGIEAVFTGERGTALYAEPSRRSRVIICGG
jgi:uncharacterized protein (UPF0261 family)